MHIIGHIIFCFVVTRLYNVCVNAKTVHVQFIYCKKNRCILAMELPNKSFVPLLLVLFRRGILEEGTT